MSFPSRAWTEYPDRARSLALVEPAAYWVLEQLGDRLEDVERASSAVHVLFGRPVTEDDLATFVGLAGFVGLSRPRQWGHTRIGAGDGLSQSAGFGARTCRAAGRFAPVECAPPLPRPHLLVRRADAQRVAAGPRLLPPHEPNSAPGPQDGGAGRRTAQRIWKHTGNPGVSFGTARWPRYGGSRRNHSACGDVPPAEFEAAYHSRLPATSEAA